MYCFRTGEAHYSEQKERFTARPESADEKIKKDPKLGEIVSPNRFFQVVTPLTDYRELPFMSIREMKKTKLKLGGCLSTCINQGKNFTRDYLNYGNLVEVFEHYPTENIEFLDEFEKSVRSEGLMSFDTERDEKPFVLLLGAPNGHVYIYHNAADIHDRLKKLLEDKHIR